MKAFELPEWGQVLVPDLSLAESFLRGTLVYFGVLALFRVVLKRQAGGVGLPDVMLAVLVSECASSAITAAANSVPNGLAAAGAMLFWSYSIDRAAHRWRRLRRWLEPGPVVLVRDGRPVKENLERERMTDEELCEQLRLNGVADVRGVKEARIETGGEVSVIPKDEPGGAGGGGPPDFDRAVERFLAAARDLRAAAEAGAWGGRHAVRV